MHLQTDHNTGKDAGSPPSSLLQVPAAEGIHGHVQADVLYEIRMSTADLPILVSISPAISMPLPVLWAKHVQGMGGEERMIFHCLFNARSGNIELN